MLVSVTERTREIGVRVAVGATEQAIQLQFLGESVMLSLIGGFAGVLFGVLALYVCRPDFKVAHGNLHAGHRRGCHVFYSCGSFFRLLPRAQSFAARSH